MHIPTTASALLAALAATPDAPAPPATAWQGDGDTPHGGDFNPLYDMPLAPPPVLTPAQQARVVADLARAILAHERRAWEAEQRAQAQALLTRLLTTPPPPVRPIGACAGRGPLRTDYRGVRRSR
ncbi:MAG TPA: hypothetical protein PKU97_09570 [Kofleriaceae bacterium]|nr:hypothetical protein [Kofleriaceae bacterium]